MKSMIFQAMGIRGILDGEKSQTRRLPENQPKLIIGFDGGGVLSYSDGKGVTDCYGRLNFIEKFSRFQVGDVFYAKETFTYSLKRNNPIFRATEPDFKGGWISSLYLSAAEARIFLEITVVDIQKLQQITEPDAIAEGVKQLSDGAWTDYFTEQALRDGLAASGRLPSSKDIKEARTRENYTGGCYSAVLSYRSLWEAINGAGSWDLDPFVFVYDFKRITREEAFDRENRKLKTGVR